MNSDVVVDVWVADLTFPGYMDRLHRLGAEFERAHPGYRIEIQGNDFRKLPMRLAEAAAAGRVPAIAEYYFYQTPVALDSRAPGGGPRYTSVQQAIGGRTEILGEPVVVDDILPVVRDYYTIDGDLVAMPTVVTTMLLYANADLLDAAGVTTLPATWGQVEAACRAVAALPQPPPAAITWANHGLFFQQAMAVQGGLLADNDNGRAGPAGTVRLASPEMLAWVRWWRQLHRDGHYLDTGKVPDWEGTFKAFATGEVALRLTSSNDLDYMTHAAQQGGFRLAVGRFPARDGVPYGGNMIAGTALWLADGLDERTRDGALAFMQFLNNPSNAADRHRVNSFVPLTRSAFELLERDGWFAEHPHHRVASDQLSTYPAGAGAGYPPLRGALYGDFAGAQDVMTRAMGDVLRTDVDPGDRFAAAEAEAGALLAAYRADCADAGPTRPESLRVEFFTGAEEYSGADLENVVALNRTAAGAAGR